MFYKRSILPICLVVTVGVLLAACNPEPEDRAETPTPTEEPVNGFGITQAATVQVITEGTSEFVGGAGSGVIYDSSGLIITNNHVIEGAAIIEVAIEGKDDLTSARVLGKSPCDDLAVLQLSGGGDYPAANLGGDYSDRTEVFAIGYPLGDPTQSITSGIVSKAEAPISGFSFTDVSPVIQTDAAINSGNSGGPLVTENGDVIGINFAGIVAVDVEGTNFAIPMSDEIQDVIAQLEKGENLHWVGMSVAPLPASGANEFGISLEPGLFVYAVDTGSPADKADIEVGDFITVIEGLPVGAEGTLDGYCGVLRSHGPEDPLEIIVLREDERCVGQLNGDALECTGSIIIIDGPPPEDDITFVPVTDTTGRIVLQLPDVWEIEVGDEAIAGSPDLNTWFESYGGLGEGPAIVPGFFMQAVDSSSEILFGMPPFERVDDSVVAEFLSFLGVPDNCEFDPNQRFEYDDSFYLGFYDVLPCDEGEYYEFVVYDPVEASFLVWIEAYVISDTDAFIVGNALKTFFVSP